MTKVAFVGANSIEFALDGIVDLCGMPELGAVQVSLYDPNAGHLALAGDGARQIVAASGAPVSVHPCHERAEALDGASYVVSELEVGGIDATRTDLDIPARYGLRQTAADTIGIGGIFRGLRTLPAGIDLARDVAARCPDAHFLSYTNPMAMLCWAVSEAVGLRSVLGFCHSIGDTHRFLAGLVGLDPDTVDFCTAGVNHQAFVLRFDHDGTSMYPRLAEVIERSPHLHGRLSVELFRRFGYFPVELDDQPAEYLPWVMRHDGETHRLHVTAGRGSARAAEHARELADLRQRLAHATVPEPTPGGTPAAQFIHAVETGRERLLYANVRNVGLITNLPDGCCVEVPCRVANGSVEPVPVGALPPQLAALNRTFLNVVELTVRAVLDGDRRYAYHAALLDPNASATLTAAGITAMCDELFAAHDQRAARSAPEVHPDPRVSSLYPSP